MNDHSKDLQTRFLREAAIVLAKEGFQLDEVHTDRLCILLDGAPLCEVTDNGGITYRNEDINEPERINAKDKVLADFNGTVLAGVQSKHGVHFVTWDWVYGHTGVSSSTVCGSKMFFIMLVAFRPRQKQ